MVDEMWTQDTRTRQKNKTQAITPKTNTRKPNVEHTRISMRDRTDAVFFRWPFFGGLLLVARYDHNNSSRTGTRRINTAEAHTHTTRIIYEKIFAPGVGQPDLGTTLLLTYGHTNTHRSTNHRCQNSRKRSTKESPQCDVSWFTVKVLFFSSSWGWW